MRASPIDVQCQRCGVLSGRVDESDSCEQCVIDLTGQAELLFGVEEVVAKWQRRGYPPEALQQAVAMSLANARGSLSGMPLTRRPMKVLGRGLWSTPSSAFDREGVETNQIRRLRRRAAMSLERLAAGLGASTTELGIWESGGVPPPDQAEAMATWFGVSVDQLLDRDAGPDHDSPQCHRCGDPAPRDRFKHGWDLAHGVELVCPYCLRDSDHDWPATSPSKTR